MKRRLILFFGTFLILLAGCGLYWLIAGGGHSTSTRQELVEWESFHSGQESREARELAWEALYMAEGSDWNWWYGDDHSSNLDMEFDKLYRDQLAAVYRVIGKPIPDFLHLPIRRR